MSIVWSALAGLAALTAFLGVGHLLCWLAFRRDRYRHVMVLDADGRTVARYRIDRRARARRRCS